MATPIPTNRARVAIDEAVVATAGALARRGDADVAVGITTDSRAVAPGGAFVALRGERHDGHAFVAAADAAGAALVVVERGRVAVEGLRASVLEVDDTLVAWGALARAHLTRWRAGAPGRRVVAITGSAGKTTTKELTAALLAEVAPCHFTAGNLNNRVGVPAMIFALDDARFCVLEMGMSLPGELDAIARVARPDVALVTNVGVAHAEGVGGRDGVMREKGAVYRALGEDGVAVVNADDPFAARAAEGTRARRVSFGASPGATYRIVRRAPERGGSRVALALAGRDVEVFLPLPGEVAAIDLAAALAAQEAASGVSLSPDRVDRALARVRLDGRATVRALGPQRRGPLVLDDTYNANPASMRAALATLAEVAGARRRVAVLGEMKELGALAEDEHRALGDAVADAGVALAIGCGGLVDVTLEVASRRGVEVARAPSAEAAAGEAVARITENDAVLVKGSRSVGAERVVRELEQTWGRAAELAAPPAPEVLPSPRNSASSSGRR